MNVTGKTVGVNGMTGMRGTYLTRRGFVRLAGAAAAGAALSGAVLSLSGCAPAGDVLRVGTKIDVPGFGFQNPETGSVEGLEVDVARELAARIKGDPNALEIVGVNVTTRGAMLDNGTLDATLATFTITDARKKTYDFSRPYYIDHIGVLVLKKSGITDLAGLDGKTVGVALSATTKDKLGAAAAEAGVYRDSIRRLNEPSMPPIPRSRSRSWPGAWTPFPWTALFFWATRTTAPTCCRRSSRPRSTAWPRRRTASIRSPSTRPSRPWRPTERLGC